MGQIFDSYLFSSKFLAMRNMTLYSVPIFYIYGLFSIVLLSLNVALNVYVCITLKNFPNSLYSNSKVIAVVPWQNIFAIFSAERNAGIFIVLTHFVLMFYKKIHLICKMYIQVVYVVGRPCAFKISVRFRCC